MSKLPPPPPPSNQPGSSKPRQQRQLRKGMPGKSQKNGASPTGKDKPSMPRWAVWALIAVAAALVIGPRFIPTTTATKFTYTEFLEAVSNGQVTSVKINNLSNTISGELTSGDTFTTTGAVTLSDADEQLLKSKNVDYDYSTPQGNFFTSLIPILLPFLLIRLIL